MGSKAPSRVRIPQSPPSRRNAKNCKSPEDFFVDVQAAERHNSASAPVAQLDRAPGYELGGREFESLRAHHLKRTRVNELTLIGLFAFSGIDVPVPILCPSRALPLQGVCPHEENWSIRLLVSPFETRAGHHSLGKVPIGIVTLDALVSAQREQGVRHLKNFGVLYDDPTSEDVWLSPAYDLVCTTAFWNHRILLCPRLANPACFSGGIATGDG